MNVEQTLEDKSQEIYALSTANMAEAKKDKIPPLENGDRLTLFLWENS